VLACSKASSRVSSNGTHGTDSRRVTSVVGDAVLLTSSLVTSSSTSIAVSPAVGAVVRVASFGFAWLGARVILASVVAAAVGSALGFA